jgi:hypothetical protein
MKWNDKIFCVCGLVLCSIVLLVGCAGLHTGAGNVSTGGMVKITQERIPMDLKVMRLCTYRPELFSPHTRAEADVYANPTAIEYRRNNPKAFAYPIGSTFVKKKFSKGKKQEEPDEIATVMVKKANTGKISDWTFNFLRLSDGNLLNPKTPAGQHSCVKCHQRYEKHGYVSRESEFALQKYLGLLK